MSVTRARISRGLESHLKTILSIILAEFHCLCFVPTYPSSFVASLILHLKSKKNKQESSSRFTESGCTSTTGHINAVAAQAGEPRYTYLAIYRHFFWSTVGELEEDQRSNSASPPPPCQPVSMISVTPTLNTQQHSFLPLIKEMIPPPPPRPPLSPCSLGGLGHSWRWVTTPMAALLLSLPSGQVQFNFVLGFSTRCFTRHHCPDSLTLHPRTFPIRLQHQPPREQNQFFFCCCSVGMSERSTLAWLPRRQMPSLMEEAAQRTWVGPQVMKTTGPDKEEIIVCWGRGGGTEKWVKNWRCHF